VSYGSGFILAFIVALWAAFVVPYMLRRYDEATQTRTVEKFSSLTRVIPHRRSGDAADVEVEVTVQTAPAPVERPVATPEMVRVAAIRRRRVLFALLTALVVVGALTVSAVVPVWAPAVPVALIAAWLVACRVQVRGEQGLSRPSLRRPRRAAAEVEDDREDTIVVSGQLEEHDPHRKHVMLEEPLTVDALDQKIQIAVPVGTTAGSGLWDPLPVTLPTYVTKPRAGRTVRTVDFGEPGTWTSGHVEGEDVRLPGRDESGQPLDAPRRAVGE
jgi:hypothetical protein